MKIDRVIVTVYPGYCFISVLCLRSIFRYLDQTPLTILIDDFELWRWPSFVDNYKKYILQQFPDHYIEFACYSNLNKVNNGNTSGWLRQQLIKLHADYFVPESNILLVDADIILKEYPDTDTIPARLFPESSTGIGFKLYCKYMLGTELRLGSSEENLGSSWAGFRWVSKELLQALRSHVEHVHNQNFLDLHINLMQNKKIVAYDPTGQTMIMTEFEMLELFRKYLWKEPLPLRSSASAFFNDNIEDWKRNSDWFTNQNVHVDSEMWNASQYYAANFV
jgi:hypothetical protein